MSSYRVYQFLDLWESLRAQFPKVGSTAIITNQTYHATTREWVDKVFAPYIRDLQFAANKNTWRKRGNQCEHFAMRAALAVTDCYDLSAQNDPAMTAESIAAAWIKFRQHKGGWHAINLFLIDGVWQPWEPQTQTWRPFVEDEAKNVTQPLVL